ncbi:MAG: hypothetical protein J7J82_04260 [Staphylothermus sp.]|nr:hypothetical protein [Staphylothermus sp.]
MPRRKITRGKHASILDFLSISSSNKNKDLDKTQEKEETIASNEDINKVKEKLEESGTNKSEENLKEKAGSAKESIDEDISDLLSILGKRKTINKSLMETTSSSTEQVPISEIANENSDLSTKSIAEIDVGKLELPTGEILDKILWEGLSKDNVVCDSTGKCTDGISVGEIYNDQYGFRRQRGYVNTTRLPVYTDWIVEEGLVKKILPRAYGLKTNRGAVALIPEDFLCELQARYGVVLLNYDRCTKYNSVLGYAQAKTSRRSRKKK